MDGLFSAVELEEAVAGQRAGFRLDRLELYNWGTFHGRVWTLDVHGDNGLLTGDIGSGKSTLVDAVTTLLLPANRISYNKAAGAEVKERSLRSYVMGYYKSERNETTGTSRPVGLRDASSFSVILGIFRNEGYDSTVSLAQVFWMKDGNAGQPDRFFVTADAPLSIATDFSDFGSDIAALRRRLRGTNGIRVYDHFPEYGKDFRRRLGIESEQAMELFHQTVSMKSVGDLNDFVRSHMLEPFDAKEWIARLVAHFEDLTKAHDAVVKARAQLEELNPLLADCDTYDALAEEIRGLDGERAALPYFCAGRKARLLERRIDELTERIAARRDDRAGTDDEIRALEEKHQALVIERAGHGGDRLGQIERDIDDAERVRDERRAKWDRFNEQLRQAGLDEIERAEQFQARRREVDEELARTESSDAGLENRLMEVAVDQKALKDDADELNTELRSLRSRRSNIPTRSLELRAWLSREIGVDEAQLPFAGELIQVRPEWSEWEGAAERLLRSFGLSLLVPDEHYPDVAGWINDHHLGARLVYYRVPTKVAPRPAADAGSTERQLVSKLEIKDSEFYPWLEQELARRAGYECVETMEEFRRAHRAVTKTGQIKGTGGRHEKDDRRRIDDRSEYVLGWSNEQKIDTLLERAAKVQRQMNELDAERRRLTQKADETRRRRDVLVRLAETREYVDVDWQAMVKRVADLTEEKQRLEAASSELERLGREIEAVERAMAKAKEARDTLVSEIGGLETSLRNDEDELERTRRRFEEPGYEAATEFFDRLAGRVDESTMARASDYDRVLSETTSTLTSLIDARGKRQSTVGNRVVQKMADFRQRYPLETAEVDNSIQAAGEYREMHRRLVDDDLPRFEAQFKDYLNTNTIRDIASFQGQLYKQVELIKERVHTINDSLVGVDYNPGRYIRLEHHWTPNTDIREFREELRACTASTVSGDASEQYSEQKFVQVKRIIERFQGREGQTEADRTWARRVTDVRNWFLFSASERWREDDSEHETYTDSGGKSGGQKEKLAYTILAASLAYQFKLEWGAVRSKAFRFVVIDEAFGRGSDESTRYALELFRRLGLQLLIVTPLQKIHVIEPYVYSVGYVDNTKEGNYSRLQSMSIEEYQERRIAHELLRSEETA
ncbi:ATP-binding protein [Phytoactinopolyspora halotolerans]|uniref:ATP-dependent exonuclease SbcCD, C subunit-like protein n=1 Tax=Phytoactinopolyspora halotolerans TaxID=1981512 RepID=A0A6L9S8E9_9ACTN|nr:SbcC/MukB-like Walker B domain-containing protein [Phytoactinopolyspora halotolerans]NEE00864.1 hypothetical protein [Phytoactinopolyspora halotolerans]